MHPIYVCNLGEEFNSGAYRVIFSGEGWEHLASSNRFCRRASEPIRNTDTTLRSQREFSVGTGHTADGTAE